MIYKTAIAFLFAALFPLQSFARDYHVEAIIFTNPLANAPDTVTWDEKAPRNIRAQNKLDTLYRQAVKATLAREEMAMVKAQEPTATTAESVNSSDDPTTEEKTINTEITFDLVELRGIQNKLERSPDHDILQTLSWNQSEAGYITSPLINTATPHMKGVIRVYAPNLLFAEINMTYVPGEILEDSIAGALRNSVDQPEIEVSPTYDTSYSSISYDSEFSIQTLPEPVIAHYFMDERRKLKLNEIHYFDHPKFGVILSVKPIESAEAS